MLKPNQSIQTALVRILLGKSFEPKYMYFYIEVQINFYSKPNQIEQQMHLLSQKFSR